VRDLAMFDCAVDSKLPDLSVLDRNLAVAY